MSVLDVLERVVPAPNYLRIPSVGVDISDTSLKYILLAPDSYSGARLKLRKWGEVNIREGALSRGEVNDVDELARVIREIKRRSGVPHVRMSLPEEHAYLFETTIKRGTPFKEIKGLLEFRLEESVPLSPRDALFDYHIFDTPEDSGSLNVAVIAYAKKTVDQYYEACDKAGVIPLSFEVEAQAIARAGIPQGALGTYMIVNFGKTRTGIGIVHHGQLMYTSTIDLGGNDLSTALRQQLGDKPEDELTTIKNNQGLVHCVDSGEVYEVLVSTVSVLKDEIALRLEDWNRRAAHPEDKFVESIVLCGGSSNLKGLPSYLSETLGIETKRTDVWQNVFDINDSLPPIGLRDSYGYATAIGLALSAYNL